MSNKSKSSDLPLTLIKCAVCENTAITRRKISINNEPKKSLPVCEIHADAADEDTKE